MTVKDMSSYNALSILNSHVASIKQAKGETLSCVDVGGTHIAFGRVLSDPPEKFATAIEGLF